MNFGTRIGTILLAISSLNLLFCTLYCVINTFNPIWLVASVIFMLVISWIAWYYNEDLTADACLGTGLTRQRKAERKERYVGDIFFDQED